MRRILGALVAVVVLVLGVGAVYGYMLVTGLEVEPVSGDVFVVFGAGGNVGVLRTGAGAVVVDTMTFRIQGERIRERAEKLTGEPVVAVVNTHHHQDHAHGNPGFPPGTRVVATRRARAYMLEFFGDYWQAGAAGTLPNDLVEDAHEMKLGSKTVRSLHLGRGHTGGDLVTLFVEDRVLHTGDLFFHDRYPNIDLEAGGSIPAWIATLDRVLELDFDRVIPGHGPVTDRGGIEAFQRFLRELWAVGQAAARDGLTLEQTLDQARLEEDAGYGVIGVPLVFRLDRDFVIRRAWEEATGSVAPREIPGLDLPDGEGA